MNSLTPNEWNEVSALFEEALSLSPSALPLFLKVLGEEKPHYQKELLSLLRSHDEARDFLETPIGLNLTEILAVDPSEYFSMGEETGDFEILEVLGKGSFATVYLARQLSLNRQVALKVSANVGKEALTMASLEHDNIVRVFSESVVEERQLRLICMQYVSGTTLEKILSHPPQRDVSSGAAFLKAIDHLTTSPTAFDASAIKDREYLSSLDLVGTVAYLGLRLSSALAFAHKRGVLHMDVKPGNILISPYGRPYLTDFNISVNNLRPEESDANYFGGTLEYMAPEHLNAFKLNLTEALPQIDQRADIFALGKVLKEVLKWLTNPTSQTNTIELERILNKCTENKAEDRFADGASLSQALRGCLEQRSILENLPPPGRITHWAAKHPFATLLTLILVPQVCGSLINIAYNSIRIVNHLSTHQQEVFRSLIPYWNLFIFSVGTLILVPKLRPIASFFNRPSNERTGSPEFLKHLRKQVLDYPLWLAAVITLCWGAASLFWPLSLYLLAGMNDSHVTLHFLISFLLSGSIALTYSFLYTQFIGLRVLYPSLWSGCADIRATAKEELKTVGSRFNFFYLLAGFIPLTGALLLVFVGPEELNSTAYDTYRALLFALIGLGMMGFVFALKAGRDIAATFHTLLDL